MKNRKKKQACASVDMNTEVLQKKPCSMTRKNTKIYGLLTGHMRMNQNQSEILELLLSTNFHKQAHKPSTAGPSEAYFGFWGFTPSEKIRNSIMHVIEHVFKPRILYTNNFDDMHFESICVMADTPTRALQDVFEKYVVPRAVSSNEDILLRVLELFNMSADIIRFDNLLNAPMVASIDRLHQARRMSYGNLTHHANVDFYELYKFKLSQRDENASVKLLTGYDLSRDSICKLSNIVKAQESKLQRMELQLSCTLSTLKAREGELRVLNARESQSRRNDASRFNAAHLLVALKNIGDISEENTTKLLQALRIRTIPVHELVKMQIADQNQGVCMSQEILMQVPTAHVRILQRPASNSTMREILQCSNAAHEAAAHEVAT